MTTDSPRSARSPRSRAKLGRAAFAALGALAALVPSLAMWGFTVDDALIPIRYAHNLASGAGYRFDAAGPSTDGVTPLPWAWLLAPMSGGDALVTLARAKALGVVAWTCAGAALGACVHRMASGRVRVVTAALALGVMALAFPIGAWAASGMETGVVTALATSAAVALALARPRAAAALAGVCGAFRPEMVLWALVVGAGAAASAAKPKRWLLVALAVGPFAACALVRLVVWGRPAPLAVLAKPSDFSHGATYALAACVVVSTPILATAPIAIATTGARVAKVLGLAFVAHVLAVIAAGGDWMPFARLLVPVAPSLVIVFVSTSVVVRPAWIAARLVVAFAFGLFLTARAAPSGRSVYGDRSALIACARPALAGARVVAGLDVGWLGASTDARVVDLAGLTDPSIALLPGGHTSKRVDVSMLLDREVDVVVLYSETRVVEARILDSDLFIARFELFETLPIRGRRASYSLYRRRAVTWPSPASPRSEPPTESASP
ncbi:MAG: hypothetical protein KF819_01535 [Labilithrix sp.]|nr:hypothetical protein [Labilithrix sp.]